MQPMEVIERECQESLARSLQRRAAPRKRPWTFWLSIVILVMATAAVVAVLLFITGARL